MDDQFSTLEDIGGKGLSLAQLANAGYSVPGGYHITTLAYRHFVEQNNLQLLQSKEPLIDDSESEILQTEPPRVEDSLLKSEELRALQVIDEITGRGVLTNSNGGIHNWDDNQTIFVPDWVKNNAKQWSEGLISDEQFSKGLEFLLNENILNKNPNSKSDEYGFPIWVKQYAGFYGDGKVSDTEFLDAFNYLIENDIISIRSD